MVTEPKLTRNAARCDACGSVVESRHRWDFQTCRCGALSVDGGLDYSRIVTSGLPWTSLCEYEPAVAPKARRGLIARIRDRMQATR
jgi:hypothetical protein